MKTDRDLVPQGTRERLEERFGTFGRKAADQLDLWLSGLVPFAYPEVIERHLGPDHLDLVFDAFYQVLPFGTGGRRGRVGYGPNRLNPTNVAMTVQGHCNFLLERYADRETPTVVVANDVRIFLDHAGTYSFLGQDHPLLGMSSRTLGRFACEIYAGNGIRVLFRRPESDDAVLTTPELSFLIGTMEEAVGGINLSASHNPPDDNGIKVYDEWGSQPVPPDDQVLLDVMSRAADIERLDFDEALTAGLIRAIDGEFEERYLEEYRQQYADLWTPRADVPIVYTPLCGCGLESAGRTLRDLGFPLLSPPDEGPDGSFESIPFNAPNPEIPEATLPAQDFAEAQGVGLVLSSDPDADRIGVVAKLRDGSWRHFDGNQIAALLCHFLMVDPKGPRRRGLVIETLVTNKILRPMVEASDAADPADPADPAAAAGESGIVDDLLVGFKWVAEVLKTLQRGESFRGVSFRPEELVLATEESHGVLTSPRILDKDATPACMYMAALYQRLSTEGRDLLDYYAEIIERFGGYDCVNRSIVMSGAEGQQSKERILTSLRDDPPSELAGSAVTAFVDYWDQEAHGAFVSESDKLPRNVLQLRTESFILTIRPSGTEPKLKLYVQLLPSAADEEASGLELVADVRRRALGVADWAYNALLERIDVRLSVPTLRLPDIVGLDEKMRFETEVLPALEKRLSHEGFDSLDEALEWLRSQTASMTPGADPLPALRAPLSIVARGWNADLATGSAELRRWAES